MTQRYVRMFKHSLLYSAAGLSKVRTAHSRQLIDRGLEALDNSEPSRTDEILLCLLSILSEWPNIIIEFVDKKMALFKN